MSSTSIPTRIYCAALAAAMLLAVGAGACAHPMPGQAASTTAPKPLPFVSPIFGDNMVLQRGKPDTIWGWSDGILERLKIRRSQGRGGSTPPPGTNKMSNLYEIVGILRPSWLYSVHVSVHVCYPAVGFA
jgi:hypothetical protein